MFSDNLKKYRRRAGFSQSELADKLYVSRQCVSKWEKGITQPDLETLNKISELLGVSIDILIKEDSSDITEKCVSSLNRSFFAANILVALFCAFAFVSLWRFLPSRIPAHWTNGVIDRYGSSAEVFLHIITAVIFLIDDVIMFFILKSVFNNKLVAGIHLIIIFIQLSYLFFIVAMDANYITAVLPFVTCLSASLVLCVSIAIHPKIAKQNQWLGVRTRESMSDKAVWNKVNSLGCYLFAGCSLMIWIVNLIVVSVWSCIGLLAYIVPAVIVIIYSKYVASRVMNSVQ